MASRLGPAQPRDVTWNGAGAWLTFSHARQENFSRTCWMTFQLRGITSSVSVTSSPSLRSRALPQHRQVLGAGSTLRSRGRCSGKGWRAGRLRVKGTTFVVRAAACSAAISSAVAELSSSSNPSANWSSSRTARSERWP